MTDQESQEQEAEWTPEPFDMFVFKRRLADLKRHREAVQKDLAALEAILVEYPLWRQWLVRERDRPHLVVDNTQRGSGEQKVKRYRPRFQSDPEPPRAA
jgi:hypothetical protein